MTKSGPAPPGDEPESGVGLGHVIVVDGGVMLGCPTGVLSCRLMAGTGGTVEPNENEAFAGAPDEENPQAKTAGEESHEDPWQYADLDADNSPPSNEVDE